MNYKELKITKNKMLKNGNKTSAIKFIESMLPLCDDLKEIHNLMLEIADLLFDTGQLEKAEKIYNEFTLLYPGSNNVEYALYKAILCCFYATLSVDRDQTKTHETLALSDRFLKRAEVFTTHLDEVKKIAQQCNVKLAKNELVVAEFYLNKGYPRSLNATQKRLELVRTTYLDKAPDVEPHLLALEYRLAEKTNNNEEATSKFSELHTKFPKKGALILANNKRAQNRIFKREERVRKQLLLAPGEVLTKTEEPRRDKQKKSVKFAHRF